MTNEGQGDDDDDLSRKWRDWGEGARMWHVRWRRSIEAETEEIFVVGCFTSFMLNIKGFGRVDQACPIDDMGLNIKGFGRVVRACPIDDMGLNIKGSRLPW